MCSRVAARLPLFSSPFIFSQRSLFCIRRWCPSRYPHVAANAATTPPGSPPTGAWRCDAFPLRLCLGLRFRLRSGLPGPGGATPFFSSPFIFSQSSRFLSTRRRRTASKSFGRVGATERIPLKSPYIWRGSVFLGGEWLTVRCDVKGNEGFWRR